MNLMTNAGNWNGYVVIIPNYNRDISFDFDHGKEEFLKIYDLPKYVINVMISANYYLWSKFMRNIMIIK